MHSHAMDGVQGIGSKEVQMESGKWGPAPSHSWRALNAGGMFMLNLVGNHKLLSFFNMETNNLTCALLELIGQHRGEWIGANQKKIGSRRIYEKYYCIGTKNSRDICIAKMGF